MTAVIGALLLMLAGTAPERLPPPRYIEDDNKVFLYINGKTYVPLHVQINRKPGDPVLTSTEFERRWQAREPNILKVVPKGGTP